jgi:hypothetical protein
MLQQSYNAYITRKGNIDQKPDFSYEQPEMEGEILA